MNRWFKVKPTQQPIQGNIGSNDDAVFLHPDPRFGVSIPFTPFPLRSSKLPEIGDENFVSMSRLSGGM